MITRSHGCHNLFQNVYSQHFRSREVEVMSSTKQFDFFMVEMYSKFFLQMFANKFHSIYVKNTVLFPLKILSYCGQFFIQALICSMRPSSLPVWSFLDVQMASQTIAPTAIQTNCKPSSAEEKYLTWNRCVPEIFRDCGQFQVTVPGFIAIKLAPGGIFQFLLFGLIFTKYLTLP